MALLSRSTPRAAPSPRGAENKGLKAHLGRNNPLRNPIKLMISNLCDFQVCDRKQELMRGGRSRILSEITFKTQTLQRRPERQQPDTTGPRASCSAAGPTRRIDLCQDCADCAPLEPSISQPAPARRFDVHEARESSLSSRQGHRRRGSGGRPLGIDGLRCARPPASWPCGPRIWHLAGQSGSAEQGHWAAFA